MFIIKLGNWMIPFKFAQLLVTHDGGKLTWVGELSLAEYLQGRQGNPLARVTLALRKGYPSARVAARTPTCLVNASCEKKKKYASARVTLLLG